MADKNNKKCYTDAVTPKSQREFQKRGAAADKLLVSLYVHVRSFACFFLSYRYDAACKTLTLDIHGVLLQFRQP